MHTAVAYTARHVLLPRNVYRGHSVFVHLNSLSIHITFDVITTRAPAQGNKNMIKIVIFALTHLLKHCITRKLLKIGRHMLRGVWQSSNSLFIHGEI